MHWLMLYTKRRNCIARSANQCKLQYEEFIESMQYEREELFLKCDFKVEGLYVFYRTFLSNEKKFGIT